MRPLVVVALDEAIELGLLLKKVLRSRPGRFLLQREVHAFVATVLLRVAGLDALKADPQAQPPHRELARAEEGAGTGEGHTVVGADHQRQAKVLKSPLKYCKCVAFPGRTQGIAAQ
jgi:hypothetical protein